MQLTEPTTSDVRRSTKTVSRLARDVTISREAVQRFTSRAHVRGTRWLAHAPVAIDDLSFSQALGFLFVLNAVSFSYWGLPKWTMSTSRRTYDGAWAMLVALRRAVDRDPHCFSPERLARMSIDEAQRLWRDGPIEIPLLHDRHRILNEVGSVIVTFYDSRFEVLLDIAKGSVDEALAIILSSFPSFGDCGVYKDTRVCFFKRAQLLVADIHWLLERRGMKGLGGYDHLTACADYKVPQILRWLGILVYSPRLNSLVAQNTELPGWSSEEVEIRACTIQAVEQIVEEYRLHGVYTTAADLNDFLWLVGQRKLFRPLPYHRTRTTCY